MSDEARRELIDYARALVKQRLVVGHTGNLSVRLEDRILITPSRVPYADLRTKDLVEVGMDGTHLTGSLLPSRELPLHLVVYRRRRDVRALVHTHSPHATAWSYLGELLLPQTEDNAYYQVGEVRTSRPASAGSPELAEAAAIALGESAAVLLGRHGVLTAGSKLQEAFDVATAVEHQAQVALLLRAVGYKIRGE